jgi:hypothetical protein
MEAVSQFFYAGKNCNAVIFQSIDAEGAYIFCILKDEELIKRFGADVDFQTDGEKVITNLTIINQGLYELQMSLLEAVKQTSSFKEKVPLLQGRRTA